MLKRFGVDEFSLKYSQIEDVAGQSRPRRWSKMTPQTAEERQPSDDGRGCAVAQDGRYHLYRLVEASKVPAFQVRNVYRFHVSCGRWWSKATSMNHDGWPSVTSILRDLGIVSYYGPPGAAAQRGRLVHAAAALLAQGQEIDPDWMERHNDILPYVDGFSAALAGPLNWFRPFSIEREIVNESERYIGHSDQEDETTLLELKTGGYPEWSRLQTAAYAMGRRLKRIVISLPGDGKFKIVEHNDPRDKDRFVVLARAWWVRNEFCKETE